MTYLDHILENTSPGETFTTSQIASILSERGHPVRACKLSRILVNAEKYGLFSSEGRMGRGGQSPMLWRRL